MWDKVFSVYIPNMQAIITPISIEVTFPLLFVLSLFKEPLLLL